MAAAGTSRRGDVTDSRVRIVSVLPALLGTYGDGGNVVVLERRLAWRGIPVQVVRTTVQDPCPAEGDLYVLGGGEDEAQLLALDVLRTSALRAVLDRGTPLLAVCAGLQLLGSSLAAGSESFVEGLGMVDLTTARLSRRAVGEVVTRPEESTGLNRLTGFVNHGGSTVLGSEARPFGQVLEGPGNAGESDPVEGVLQGSVIGTYLHGPVLARNPALADLLLTRAVGSPLPHLEPGLPEQLHAERLARRG
ncbi:MAG: CobB/CobQ domain protein glutamine amidotransferase [Frankiales bacterium]|nr:CobB/CobQ domain protein glutamine amidotransferase [Frankiales bacterium]